MRIEIGCRVSAFVGPKKNKRKTKFKGTVIASQPDQSWTVWWDNIAKCSNHKAKILKFESPVMEGMELKEERLKDMIENFFVEDPTEEFNQIPDPGPQPCRRLLLSPSQLKSNCHRTTTIHHK